MTIKAARLLQIVGILLITVGFTGFWLDRVPQQTILTEVETMLLNPERETFQASFLVAGRDYNYTQQAGTVIRDTQGNVIGRTHQAVGSTYGTNTDSIFYVNMTGNRVYMIGIPRDIWLEEYGFKISSLYSVQGADGLRRKVSELLNVPIDYHVIVNMDVFKRVVDALGGVSIYVSSPMKYTDYAAGLYIDFEVGHHHMMGDDAEAFVRFRRGAAGDLGRIDNFKRLGVAMLERFKTLNFRTALLIPELIDIVFSDVETNLDLRIATQLARRLPGLNLHAATLPALHVEKQLRDRNLGTVQVQALELGAREVENFLANVFGGEAREVVMAPDATLLITNRSGLEGLAYALKERLVRMGVSEGDIIMQEGTVDYLPTRVQIAEFHWQEAGFYADMLNVQQLQVFQLEAPPGTKPEIEIVLGEDAQDFWGFRHRASFEAADADIRAVPLEEVRE